MSASGPLGRIPLLYHFTDRRNLSQIRSCGGLFPMAELRKRGFQVPAPGGNDWSRDADALKGMGNYVHLCFRNNHPMEYVARQDGRIVDSVFLRIHPSVLSFAGVRFTDDVSNKSGVTSIPIDDATEIIDFEVLYTRTDWTDPEVLARLRRVERYEVLIPSYIPLSLIENIDNG